MNPAYFSAFAALAGSVIGGLTTFAAAWVTQRQQANVQWLLQERTRRQELYQAFIEEASKLYVDALMQRGLPRRTRCGDACRFFLPFNARISGRVN